MEAIMLDNFDVEAEVKKIFDREAISLTAYNDLYGQIVRLVERAMGEVVLAEREGKVW
jgi:hypothetical protein